MNSFFASVLLLRSETINDIIEILFWIIALGIFIVPLIFIILDIKDRYENKFLRVLLAFVAIFFYPIFIFAYFLFRKKTTIREDKDFEQDLNINLIGSESIQCPKCSSVNARKNKHCHSCGIYLTNVCMRCKHIVELDWNFCTTCGVHLVPTTIPNSNKHIKAKALTQTLGYKIISYMQ